MQYPLHTDAIRWRVDLAVKALVPIARQMKDGLSKRFARYRARVDAHPTKHTGLVNDSNPLATSAGRDGAGLGGCNCEEGGREREGSETVEC